MSSCAISVTPTFLCKQITNFPIGHSQYNKDVCHILFQIFIQNEITSRRHFPKTSKGKKTGINKKRPLFVALATETDKDVDKNSCRNNQATEHGNKYDMNTRGSLFHLHRFGRIVTLSHCRIWSLLLPRSIGLANSPILPNCRCPLWNGFFAILGLGRKILGKLLTQEHRSSSRCQFFRLVGLLSINNG